jgi:hypothetical protein
VDDARPGQARSAYSGHVVPTELLVTAMVGGFAIALTAVLATVRVLGARIGDVRDELHGIRQDFSARFDGVDSRFTSIDSRFDGVDSRFTSIDSRFDSVDSRFTSIDSRFTDMDTRFTAIDSRFTDMDTRFTGIESRIAGLQDDMVTVRASLAAIDARLSTLEDR